MSVEKGVADRRSAPKACYRSNRTLWQEGRLLLFCNLNDQTDNADKYKTKLKQLIISDHIDHPLP